MILIGLGANLPTKVFGPPRAALGAALAAIEKTISRLSNMHLGIKRRRSPYPTNPGM